MSGETPNQTVILYRPVGPKELQLIRESDFAKFPPRLPEQPIFYPVTSLEYASQIARDWNAKDASTGYTGYVTRFEVRAAYLARFEAHRVGGAIHEEYWIPSEELADFNRNIVGRIEVVVEFRGSDQ